MSIPSEKHNGIDTWTSIRIPMTFWQIETKTRVKCQKLSAVPPILSTDNLHNIMVCRQTAASPCLTGVKRVLEVSWTLFRTDRGAFTHPDRPWCVSRTRGNLRSTKFQGTYATWSCQSHTDITRRTDHEEARWTNRRDWSRPRLASRGEHQTSNMEAPVLDRISSRPGALRCP